MTRIGARHERVKKIMCRLAMCSYMIFSMRHAEYTPRALVLHAQAPSARMMLLRISPGLPGDVYQELTELQNRASCYSRSSGSTVFPAERAGTAPAPHIGQEVSKLSMLAFCIVLSTAASSGSSFYLGCRPAGSREPYLGSFRMPAAGHEQLILLSRPGGAVPFVCSTSQRMGVCP